MGDPGSLFSCHRDIGIPINFQEKSGIFNFEVLHSACFSSCQKDVRPTVEMRRGPRGFSMVSTGDSDIPSSCEMKDEPAFKPRQGNQPSFKSGHLNVRST